MPNTMIFPTITQAAQTVSREAVGFCRAVTLRGSEEPAAQGQTVRIPLQPTLSATNYTPSLAPSLTDRTITAVDVTLSQAREVNWHITGEQMRGLDNGNADAQNDLRTAAEQAFRTLANEIDGYIFDLVRVGAWRAEGTAGTTPFGSDLTACATIGRVLNEGGAPLAERKLVLDPAAYANLQARFANVQTTRDDASFSRGEIPPISGLTPFLSIKATQQTAGTGSSWTLASAHSAGATTISVTGGSGTILAGDIVTIGGRRYVVKTGLSSGSFTINAPGLVAAAASGAAVTVNNTAFTPNIALTPDAVYMVARPIAQVRATPSFEYETVVDTVSGIPFQVAMQYGDGVARISVRVLYGGAVITPQHIAVLLG